MLASYLIVEVNVGFRALFLALVVCAGCAGPLTQRAAGARQLYRDDGFGREHLREGGIAFLAPSISFGQETLGHALLPGLFDAFQGELPDANIVPPDLAASRINEAGLSNPYAQIMRSYDRTGILERETLAHIAEAIESRYLAVPILVSLREETFTRFSVFGIRVGKTTVTNTRVQLEIWDAKTGRIVWEALSDVTLAQEVVRERSIHFERAVRMTWDYLLEQLPNSGITESSPDR
jgi:hypothetical protein